MKMTWMRRCDLVHWSVFLLLSVGGVVYHASVFLRAQSQETLNERMVGNIAANARDLVRLDAEVKSIALEVRETRLQVAEMQRPVQEVVIMGRSLAGAVALYALWGAMGMRSRKGDDEAHRRKGER
ncbi:MAG: hypothetical protein AB7G23_03060 [Vicinamibacterales bacterium]